MEDQFLNFAGIVAVGVIVLVLVLGRRDRKDVPATDRPGDRSKERVRRGAGNALLGLQGFIEPSVEHIFQVQNVEQKDEEDDNGLGWDEDAIRSDLAESLGRTPVDPEEVRRHLAVAARAGLDWKSVFEEAVENELRERPFRAPYIPPPRRVAPRQ
jgi:hypothetical protein